MRASTDGDVLRALRAGTAAEHEQVERTLDLLDPRLGADRLCEVLDRLHGFWTVAEAGLDSWAHRHPDDAAALDWPNRRRARLFAEDLRSLGSVASGARPDLPALPGTDEALGRMYVLEGSTLGGALIDRHLAGLPQLAGTRLRAFSPYGDRTGAMWQAFRRVTRERMAAGGEPDAAVASARTTFDRLARWCRLPERRELPAAP